KLSASVSKLASSLIVRRGRVRAARRRELMWGSTPSASMNSPQSWASVVQLNGGGGCFSDASQLRNARAIATAVKVPSRPSLCNIAYDRDSRLKHLVDGDLCDSLSANSPFWVDLGFRNS